MIAKLTLQCLHLVVGMGNVRHVKFHCTIYPAKTRTEGLAAVTAQVYKIVFLRNYNKLSIDQTRGLILLIFH